MFLFCFCFCYVININDRLFPFYFFQMFFFFFNLFNFSFSARICPKGTIFLTDGLSTSVSVNGSDWFYFIVGLMQNEYKSKTREYLEISIKTNRKCWLYFGVEMKCPVNTFFPDHTLFPTSVLKKSNKLYFKTSIFQKSPKLNSAYFQNIGVNKYWPKEFLPVGIYTKNSTDIEVSVKLLNKVKLSSFDVYLPPRRITGVFVMSTILIITTIMLMGKYILQRASKTNKE